MRSDTDSAPERIVLLGVPGSRRVTSFIREAHRLGVDRVEVIPYLDWLEGRCANPLPGSLIRIESPSECFATTQAILKAGIAPSVEAGSTSYSQNEIDRHSFERGEMLHPRQWFHGFREILKTVENRWSGPGIRWMSHPGEIATMFDKLACLNLWTQADLPIPHPFPGIRSYSQLRSEIVGQKARIFVKLRYGYSAMGAVALEWRGSLVRAITTMQVALDQGLPRFFVSKRPSVLTNESEIAWLIDSLAKEDIIVEPWLPKARWEGKNYDLRIIMIGGKMHHVVGRANSSPFTNLNLDAIRISQEDIQNHLDESWSQLENLCEQAATQIAKDGIMGLDVLVHPDRRRFSLLEANAFGDYLPRLMHRGQSIYEAELRYYCRIGKEATP